MIDKILVGSAFPLGEEDDAVLETAAELARAHDAELVLVQSVPRADFDQLFESAATPNVEGAVDRLAGKFPNVKARTAETAGDPVETIWDVAKEEEPDVVLLTKRRPADDVGDGDPAPAQATDGGPSPVVEEPPARRRSGIRDFYSRPGGWLALLVTAGLLTYGGGTVMYWLHAVYRGERGPAISDWSHWLLDSTIGFLALTPVLFLIIPAVVSGLTGTGRSRRPRVWAYVLLVGTLFTLVTGPGPLLHNAIAGQGTPLANLATDVFGEDADIAARNMHAMEHSAFTEGLLQVAVGLPVYLTLTWLAIRLVRAVTRRRRAAEAEASPREGAMQSAESTREQTKGT